MPPMDAIQSSAACQTTSLVTCPAAPGVAASPDFTVMANGTPVFVERIGSKLESFDYPLYGERKMEDMNAASFDCSGKATITVSAAEAVRSCVIRPKARNIVPQINGHDVTFTICGPQKLYLEINELPHLALFANPLEREKPERGKPGIVHYGPGVHDLGDVVLESGQTHYLAGGAILKANFKGVGLQNVRIFGRGILQGTIKISDSSEIHVEGIFIRNNTHGWTNTLTHCRHCSYRNVKVFSYEAIYSADGINPVSCSHFVIDDCFLRCRDDCIAIKSKAIDLRVDSIQVTNNVLVGWACGDGVTLGYELNGSPVENVLVKNCDILYARSSGRTGGHSGFSIVCDGPAWVRNIRFEDIRVEEQIEFKNLEIIVTSGKLYGKHPPGHIQGVHLKNIQWENAEKPFVLSGYGDENLVEDVTFENCRVAGKRLSGTCDADFRINAYVRNVRFISGA
jgi:hypothetical protein